MTNISKPTSNLQRHIETFSSESSVNHQYAHWLAREYSTKHECKMENESDAKVEKRKNFLFELVRFTTSSCDKGSSFVSLCNALGMGTNDGFRYGFSYRYFRAVINSMFLQTWETVKTTIKNQAHVEIQLIQKMHYKKHCMVLKIHQKKEPVLLIS